MASGTGKTLVGMWAAEQEAQKTVLVLVPSLTLLQQTLLQWCKHRNKPFEYIAVCSDPTVVQEDDIDKTDFDFPIDTYPAVVRQFLKHRTTNMKVIFSTYQSSSVVGEGARDLPPFDFAIFDEAHRTTGYPNKFSYALSDENIRIGKRLFQTATPRHIDIHNKRNKEGEFNVYSMDDKTAYGPRAHTLTPVDALYGPRAHTLTFGAAAEKGIICPYKVVISLINKQMVNDFARKHGIVLIEKDAVEARWMANLIAVQQAVHETKAKKIITFHPRISTAEEFANNDPRGIAYHLPDYEVNHVNGHQKSDYRREILESFVEAPKGLLTNARVLTEGIVVPAVDMVAFVGPRRSQVDIAQAVGRAKRTAPGKKLGYIVVPLFADQDQMDEQFAIQEEGFDDVADVLNAMLDHDEELVDIIRNLRQQKGEGKPFDLKRLRKKLQLTGPFVNLDALMKSISVKIVDRIGSSWDEWFGLLMKFMAREGHCNVPAKHREGTFPLGQWVINQRQNIKHISDERRRRLDNLGFVWVMHDAWWEEGYAALEKFKAREGHCDVPQGHVEGTFRLGAWVSTQRQRKDTLSQERR
jgi:predicted helicase